MSSILFIILVQATIASILGGMILRGACSLYNRLFGGPFKPLSSATPPPKSTESKHSDSEPAAELVDDPNDLLALDQPYSSPKAPRETASSVPRQRLYDVPIPRFAKAFTICLATWFINLLIEIGVAYAHQH